MRQILINLGSGESGHFFGKDLAETDAPQEVLEEASKLITGDIKYPGMCAEDYFCELIRKNGYKIRILESLDQLEIYSVSAKEF